MNAISSTPIHLHSSLDFEDERNLISLWLGGEVTGFWGVADLHIPRSPMFTILSSKPAKMPNIPHIVSRRPTMSSYAHPDILVETDWLAQNLNNPNIRLVESDEDVLLYDTGHIPGAVKIDWHQDLNDPVVRDYLTAERFAALLSKKGIAKDTTVVFYGDKNNWWATYSFWVFKLFGHADTRILNGGRKKWED